MTLPNNGATTLSITTLSPKTFCISGEFVIISLMLLYRMSISWVLLCWGHHIQWNIRWVILKRIVILNVIMLSVIKLMVIMISTIMLSVVKMSVFMLIVIKTECRYPEYVIMASIIIQIIVLLSSVYWPLWSVLSCQVSLYWMSRCHSW